MPIKPALTKEEWELVKENGLCGVSDAHTIDTNYGIHYLDEHAVAALHLQGRKFGFVWEDVDFLRWWQNHVREDRGELIAEGFDFEGIADRIAALLPPRDVE